MMMRKANSTVIGQYTGKCCDGTVENANGMFLSTELFDTLLNSDEYKSALANGYYIGFLGHPEDPNCMDFEHACIVMTECHMDTNGEIYGTFNLIDTPVGRVVKSFIDAGVNFGISIRGAGDVDAEGNVDPDTFIFRGFDLVTFPAYEDAVPTFQEIAASHDINKQVKYKKICRSVDSNLSKITSSEALDVIQSQFGKNSAEYKKISNRIAELSKVDASTDIIAARVESMTSLYLEEKHKNDKLRSRLKTVAASNNAAQTKYKRTLRKVKRIAASQQSALEQELASVTASLRSTRAELRKAQEALQGSKEANAVLVKANSRLKGESKSLIEDNLTYKHKIESSSRQLEKDARKLDKMQDKVSETVTANRQLRTQASNSDAQAQDAHVKLEACESMLFEYQKAYANIFANALGIHLDNIEITSTTSVSELQNMISAGTNTCNISASPVGVEEIESEDSMLDEDSDVVSV